MLKIISVVGARPNFMNPSCMKISNYNLRINKGMKVIRKAHENASLSSRAGFMVGLRERACLAGRQVTKKDK